MRLLESVNRLVWGIPALVLILGVGAYLSFVTGFAQIRLFPQAWMSFWKKLRLGKKTEEGVSSFQALCTALAATVGTGNIAGVAGAIAIGGPGAIFWMWICALLGMVTKYAEAVLAVCFREKNSRDYAGGPMYMIEKGLGSRWKWMASLYAFFGVIAAFGVGNATQVNAVIGGINSALDACGIGHSTATDLLVGILVAVLIGMVLLGGARRIGAVAELLVPFAAAGYLILCFGVLIHRAEVIPQALRSIISGAFSPGAVTGGMVGSTLTALRTGVSRGVFTNEAGMGTASMAHAGAAVSHPAEQGLMGIMEVFLDTIVICTMTALVILCSGVSVPFGIDEGVTLTIRAFSGTYGEGVSIPIALFLCCFAFATIVGWGLYGLRCCQYLFGERAWKGFVWVQCGAVILSVLLQTGTVWLLSETVNGLMAIPNLIALAVLSPKLADLTREYRNRSARSDAPVKVIYSVPGGEKWSHHRMCRSGEDQQAYPERLGS